MNLGRIKSKFPTTSELALNIPTPFYTMYSGETVFAALTPRKLKYQSTLKNTEDDLHLILSNSQP